MNDFEVVKAIGKGGFSKVFQVRRKSTGMIYAMKVINKQMAVENWKAERDIMAGISHPFIVKLHHAFQSVFY